MTSDTFDVNLFFFVIYAIFQDRLILTKMLRRVYFEMSRGGLYPLFLSEAPPSFVLWPAHAPANQNAPSGNMAVDFRLRCIVLLLCTFLLCVLATEDKDKPKKKKDIRDYNDADMARLLEQWEVC